MASGAIIDGEYRYLLWREWGDGPRACFVMLNPSTADAEQDDPTIRRCIGFAKAWGCGSLSVVNLFALRATDPSELRKHPAPIGPDNLSHVEAVAGYSDTVVCAWGAHPFAREQAARTLATLQRVRHEVMCLRQTKAGHPAHPLYLPASLRPIPLAPAPPKA